MKPFRIRPADPEKDYTQIWRILRPIIRAGETYPLPQEMNEEKSMDYWLAPNHNVFVWEEEDGDILGTYYIRPNQFGRGSHIANCGYMVYPDAQGKGVASAMCTHSMEMARGMNFHAIQFNFVVSTNEAAVNLWQKMGFRIIGTLPRAFNHPTHGLVDAHIMFLDFRDS